MGKDRDHYEIYYADKLWNLLPAIYRAEDTDILDKAGPLREMVNRIGVQSAIIRRSIDRMWEDQSIETCDDWVIAYIGDLLATRLVANLDARGQRLDVAKTIYYRRRAGTVAILEEIAANITGWDARVVEFFRRLSRTRHNLDPEIGSADGNSTLQSVQGLIGPVTNTPIGGWADLRNVYGASKTHSAFDEFFFTADFRRGRDQVGWHNIPRLGVFLWRLKSFALDKTTPVAIQNCPDHYTFDPTGRIFDPNKQQLGLFAGTLRFFGDKWISPQEWQLPTPISQTLLEKDLKSDQQKLYSFVDPTDSTKIEINSLGVFRRKPENSYELVSAAEPTPEVTIDPERGRFKILNPKPNDKFYVTYHYGFSSTIGAGSFDRRILGTPATPKPELLQPVTGGENALAPFLANLAPRGTLSIEDSLTYNTVNNVGSTATGIQAVTLLSLNKTRPLIRLPDSSQNTTEWVFTGGDGSTLVLEGLFISGGDIVLRGKFDKVTLTCCTLDPGNSGDAENPPTVYAKAADGRNLIPCRLWIEGEVRQMQIDRCVVGPIRTRAKGNIVESLTINDSIVQAIRTSGFGLFNLTDLKDPTSLASKLRDAHDPLSAYLKAQFTTATQQLLNGYNSTNLPSPELQQALIAGLNVLLSGTSLYNPQRFQQVRLTRTTQTLIAQNPQGTDLLRLNRLLLEEAYPVELADKAIALTSGELNLNRCTLLGSSYVHRLEASECILDDIMLVEDVQHGCVRFSAWTTGSILPRPYESVEIAPKSSLFTTRFFSQPGYAQLRENADTAILTTVVGATIVQGAQNGSEMGAFAREKNPIKERSLRLKYEEFMPLGLVPVIIYVT